MVLFLSDRFQVRIPRVKMGRNSQRGFYRRSSSLISIGRQCEPWVVAHEFAHHVDQLKYTTLQKEWHSESYYLSLLQVITALGVENYPWEEEYRQLRRWAERDGYLGTPHAPVRFRALDLCPA
jgi:hypothetical protein